MFLACVEIADRGVRRQADQARVLQLKFNHFETAKVWAQEEASRRRDATGNAAVFETMGAYLSLAWEHEAADAQASIEAANFTTDQLAARA